MKENNRKISLALYIRLEFSDKPLHVLKEIDFARFSLQQSLSEYFPFKT